MFFILFHTLSATVFVRKNFYDRLYIQFDYLTNDYTLLQ